MLVPHAWQMPQAGCTLPGGAFGRLCSASASAAAAAWAPLLPASPLLCAAAAAAARLPESCGMSRSTAPGKFLTSIVSRPASRKSMRQAPTFCSARSCAPSAGAQISGMAPDRRKCATYLHACAPQSLGLSHQWLGIGGGTDMKVGLLKSAGREQETQVSWDAAS